MKSFQPFHPRRAATFAVALAAVFAVASFFAAEPARAFGFGPGAADVAEPGGPEASATVRATAEPPTTRATAGEPTFEEPGEHPHPNPRVKLSYRTFSISNVDASSVSLGAYELELFPLSMRWVRGGMSILGGKSHGSIYATPVTLRYGMVGLTGGFQYPARVTPFVVGLLSGGVLSGNTDGVVTIPGTTATIDNASGTTWIYARGLDFGAEVYTVGRLYVSGSIGWLRTTWRGPDVAAIAAAPTGGVKLKDLTGDSLTLKIGLGF